MDMSAFVIPKSDQINADDLISGPRTIRITKVSGTGNAEQPIAVHFDGDDGKPYKPCKSMRRVMIAGWGVDAAQYVGRSMTLYHDPRVVFGGMAVGGIRISHMSHIDKPLNLALTVTKAKRAPYKVIPLAQEPGPADAGPARATAVDPAHGDGDFTKGASDDPGPGTTGSGGRAPTPWESGAVAKSDGRNNIPLINPATGETRFFTAVPTWCEGLKHLVDTGDWHDVWSANLETHAKLVQATKNPEMQGHLKAVADHADAARQAEKTEARMGA